MRAAQMPLPLNPKIVMITLLHGTTQHYLTKTKPRITLMANRSLNGRIV